MLMKNLSSAIVILFTSIVLAAPLQAEVQGFDFKDPKGVNAITFLLDSELEPIAGLADGISGEIQWDNSNPATAKGSIQFPVANIRFANPMMGKKAQTEEWLNAAAHVQVAFELTGLKDVKTTGNKTEATLVGTMSLAGVQKDIAVQGSFTYLKDAAPKRGGADIGDLLILRSDFTIKRGDFGIKPGQVLDKVGGDIQIRVAISGYGI